MKSSCSPSHLLVTALALVPAQGFVTPIHNNVQRVHDSTNLLASSNPDNSNNEWGALGLSALLAMTIFAAPAFADGQTSKFTLPPIDLKDPYRCQITSSSMGQSNAARDKLYDLRMCKLPNSKASGYDLSGVIMTDTDVSGSDFREAYFSKAYLHESNFDGTDFTNAIVDRASFKGSSLKGAMFTNAVLTGTSFENANVENADFSDAYIGDFDVRALCRNPTLKGENPTTGMDTRISAGCK